MPDTILVALKLIFVAFVYLFVWQIAKSIAAHVGTGQPRTRTKPGAGLVVIRSETQAGLNLDVRDSLVIGRSEEADIQIEDTYASEFHVRLVNDTGILSLHDLGSTNGTYVNGRRVTVPLDLNKGDAVQDRQNRAGGHVKPATSNQLLARLVINCAHVKPATSYQLPAGLVVTWAQEPVPRSCRKPEAGSRKPR